MQKHKLHKLLLFTLFVVTISCIVQSSYVYAQPPPYVNITKLATFDIARSPLGENGIYGDGLQRRVLWSNVTQRWYIFYTNNFGSGSIDYAVMKSDGTIESINNTFIHIYIVIIHYIMVIIKKICYTYVVISLYYGYLMQ